LSPRLPGLLLCAALLCLAGAAEAGAVKVRLPEGTMRGFLVLRAGDGTPIASGELRQKPAGNTIESRLLLAFKDGSVREETVTYSQQEVFRLEAYRLVQRGPSFPTTDIAFDRRSGRYTARTQEKKGAEEKSAGGELEMPEDLYNGMELVVLKNLPAGGRATGMVAAFTPKPRLVKMELGPEGEERVLVAGEPKKATRHLVKLEIGGLTGLVASIIGKEPPDLRYWLVEGEVPAFVRFQGAMFLNGPVWRLELAPITWP
jgi:hypothetical protein